MVLLALFNSLIFGILLIIVWIANPKRSINRVFSLFLISGFVWGLLVAFWGMDITPSQERFLVASTAIFGIYPAVLGYFFFGLVFLQKDYRPWLFYVIPTYIFLCYLMTTEAITYVRDEPFLGGSGPHQRAGNGDLLPLAIAWGGSLILILIAYLIKELRKKLKDKVHSQKVKLFLLTTIIVAAFVIFYNITPALWNYPIDILGLLVAAALLTYGILRYELVDVNVKLRNTLANIIFAIILTVVYVSLIASLRFIVTDRFDNYLWWTAIVAAIYLTSMLQPLRERVLRFIDVALYRVRYDYRETINKFTSLVGEILELEELAGFITKTIENTFEPKSAHLFVLSEGKYQPLKGPQKSFLVKEGPFIDFLRVNERAIGEEEISKSLASFDEVKRLNPKVIIPLRSGKDLIGFLSIGQRTSEDFYSQEDKNLLFTLGQASAIALKNALLYQEVLDNKEEIEKLLGHEREVNESKNEFVSIVSHYLRTPLTSIKGCLDLLLKGAATSKEREEYLIRVSNEQKKLSTLVEDLISISALERGELHLFKTKVSLVSLIKKVVDDYTLSVNEKGLYLKTAFNNKVDTFNADSQKLAQAISNLVDNAIKFTNVGGVTIKVGKEDSKAIICVEDTGIGIDQQQIPKLFQKFHRGTDVKTFNYEGSGLGLYITKLIIEAHRGEIKVSSELGKGSRFCVYLPITR
jgi:signal transduction histidine kinase